MNDQARGNSFNFSHSPDNVSYTNKNSLDYTSPAAADIVEIILSSEKNIVTFVLARQSGDAIINTTDHTVNIEVIAGTNITALSSD